MLAGQSAPRCWTHYIRFPVDRWRSNQALNDVHAKALIPDLALAWDYKFDSCCSVLINEANTRGARCMVYFPNCREEKASSESASRPAERERRAFRREWQALAYPPPHPHSRGGYGKERKKGADSYVHWRNSA